MFVLADPSSNKERQTPDPPVSKVNVISMCDLDVMLVLSVNISRLAEGEVSGQTLTYSSSKRISNLLTYCFGSVEVQIGSDGISLAPRDQLVPLKTGSTEIGR